MILRIIALTILLSSSISYAQENLISCGTSAGYQFRCSIPATTILLQAQPVESDYSLSYQMTCDRNYPDPVASRIKISIANGTTFTLNYKDKKESVKVGTGTGELSLFDSFPKELAGLKFQECSLKIWDVKATPSTRVVNAWKAEKLSLEAQISLAVSARDANKALAVLESALGVYSKFMDSILATEASENELITAIVGLKECATAGDDPVTCERTIDKLATASSLFTADETSRLSKLQVIIDRINFSAITCPATGDCTKAILKKYLSDEDLALLEEAKGKLKEADGASDRATNFGKLVESLTLQLNTLKEISKGYVQW